MVKKKLVGNTRNIKWRKQRLNQEQQLLKSDKKIMTWNTIILSFLSLSTLFMVWKCWQIMYAKTETHVKNILNQHKREILASSVVNMIGSIIYMNYMLRGGYAFSFDKFAVAFNMAFSLLVLNWSVALNTGKLEVCVKTAVANINTIMLLYLMQVFTIINFILFRWYWIRYDQQYIKKRRIEIGI
jgi:hypothetical protein